MSIVQQYEPCPQCAGIADHTVNLGNGEEFIRCFCCGRKHFKKVTFTPDNMYQRDENGKIIYTVEDIEGFGVVSAGYQSGESQLYYLDEEYCDTVQKNFDKLLRQECIDKGNTYFTRWDKEQNKVIAVYGKLPESFEEYTKGDKT